MRQAAVRWQGGGAYRRAAAHLNRMVIERAPACLAPCQRLSLEVEPRFGACAGSVQKVEQRQSGSKSLEDAAAMTAAAVPMISASIDVI